MNLVRKTPIADLNRMQHDVDSLFASVMPFSLDDIDSGIAPIDIYREDGKIHLEVTLSKFHKDEISVEQEGREIIVTAQHADSKKSTKDYIWQESRQSLYRVVTLPKDADSNDIKIQFKDGVLDISTPILKKAKSKKLQIDVK